MVIIKNRYLGYIIMLLILVSIIVVWNIGLFGIWTKGIGHIAGNTEEYTRKDGHLLAESYSFDVDLSDFESNLLKEIYNDGEHSVYIALIHKTHDGNYNIGFQTRGSYHLKGATLISALNHEALSDQSFTSKVTAKMIVEHNGNVYDAEATGQCGINYKDGDCFNYSFFLDEERIADSSIVTLTVTGLYKNIWCKRD